MTTIEERSLMYYFGVLYGGTDNDLLNGSLGDDTYLFNAGDGRDVIQDMAGANTVVFGVGLTATAMTVSQSMAADGERDLDLDFASGERLSVPNGEAGMVGSFRFADGVEMRSDDALARLQEIHRLARGGRNDRLVDSCANRIELGDGLTFIGSAAARVVRSGKSALVRRHQYLLKGVHCPRIGASRRCAPDHLQLMTWSY